MARSNTVFSNGDIDDLVYYLESYNPVIYQGSVYIKIPYDMVNDKKYLKDPMPADTDEEDKVYVRLSKESIGRLIYVNQGWAAKSANVLKELETRALQRCEYQSSVENIVQYMSMGKDKKKRLVPKVKGYNNKFISGAVYLEKGARNKEIIADIESVIKDWVNSENVADNLLNYTAYALLPEASCEKMVLLLGSGSNGKSVYLKMLEKIFDGDLLTRFSRQQMAREPKTLVPLNNALINICHDAPALFIKDNSIEKALITGEPVSVNQMRENGTLEVQTNAFFIEALNHEPNLADKSVAAERRLARIRFPNSYTRDKSFQDKMLSDDYVNHLFTMLMDRAKVIATTGYPLPESTKTEQSEQYEHMIQNSRILSYFNVHVDKAQAVLDDVTSLDITLLVRDIQLELTVKKELEISERNLFTEVRKLFTVKRVKKTTESGQRSNTWFADGFEMFTEDCLRYIVR